MSRIAKQPIDIPEGVDININNGLISIKGPKGEISMDLSSPGAKVDDISFNQLIFSELPAHCPNVDGKRIMLEANIGGITPAILSFKGK